MAKDDENIGIHAEDLHEGFGGGRDLVKKAAKEWLNYGESLESVTILPDNFIRVEVFEGSEGPSKGSLVNLTFFDATITMMVTEHNAEEDDVFYGYVVAV